MRHALVPAEKPSTGGGLLTFTGGLLTDTTRLTDVEGDGLSAYGGIGIWPAATNLVTNGGFETDTTGWEGTGAAIARITTDSKFGAACLEATVSSAADLAGARLSAGVSVSAGTAYTGSVWLKASTGTPTVSISLVEYTALDAFVQTNTLDGVVLNTSTWTRIELPITTSGTTGIIRIYAATYGSQTATFKVDGVQLETGLIATPYVETDGGTASRTAGRVRQTAAGVVTTAGGWYAVRFRPAYANTYLATLGDRRLVSWRTDGSNALDLILENSGTGRLNFNAGAAATAAAITFTAQSGNTAVGKWLQSGGNYTVGVSFNGAAFTTATGAQATPTLPATIEIGTLGPNGTAQHTDGNILWYAIGIGQLTDEHTRFLNGFGDYAPSLADLIRAMPGAQPTSVWNGANASFEVVA